MLRNKKAAITIALVLLSGCATSEPVYTQSGQQGYQLTCSGSARSWGMCYKKAGEICGAKGYKVLSQNGDNAVMMGALVTNREMTVECRR